ncbi:hypothetical protein [Ruegeria sp. B32]|uniref:hypothetical protein n=1 Tax=Ruegeria sp. B32 TaxID=2867020 RepID=UPI0021A54EB3|nr:hypothetical protein [Ruegeria sp. B32]UWR09247.1 hypothetical protein K3752_18635 [Ruegeria sp. B32]
MVETKLVPIRFEGGVWEGHYSGSTAPQLEARYRDQILQGIEVSVAEGGWHVLVPVPTALLSEGVHSVIILDSDSQEKVGDITVIAGAPAVGDIRAEMDLLRAELDLLKRVVRRLSADQG